VADPGFGKGDSSRGWSMEVPHPLAKARQQVWDDVPQKLAIFFKLFCNAYPENIGVTSWGTGARAPSTYNN